MSTRSWLLFVSARYVLVSADLPNRALDRCNQLSDSIRLIRVSSGMTVTNRLCPRHPRCIGKGSVSWGKECRMPEPAKCPACASDMEALDKWVRICPACGLAQFEQNGTRQTFYPPPSKRRGEQA
jgi:hypothetical protein